MHITLIAGGVLSLAAWVYLLFAHGSFWRISKSQPALPITNRPTIAVVIPARNEADVIARAITSLLHQQIDANLHIILVDDASTDSTAEIAHQAAVSANMSDFLTILNGQPLPTGWSGKVWAQHQGISKALELNPDYLLLTDADIEHAPSNLANLVALAENNRTDLTSFMAKLRWRTLVRTLADSRICLLFLHALPACLDSRPSARHSGRRREAACSFVPQLLPRPVALSRSAARSSTTALSPVPSSRRVAISGFFNRPETARSIRPYESVAEIGGMISRSAFNQLGHSTLLLIGTIFGLAILYLLPIALLFSRSTLAISLAAATLIAMLIAYAPISPSTTSIPSGR